MKKFQDTIVPGSETKAILLLDNASAHPAGEDEAHPNLFSADGKIHCMFLPPNTTLLIQPMDQGIIAACKRHYRRKFLEQCLVVLEDKESVTDSRGERTLAHMKAYNIKDTLFNLTQSWTDLKVSTLKNCWKKLLDGVEMVQDLERFEVEDYRTIYNRAGEQITENDDQDWLDCDENDGCETLTRKEIVAEILHPEQLNEDKDESSIVDDAAECFPGGCLLVAKAGTLGGFPSDAAKDHQGPGGPYSSQTQEWLIDKPLGTT